MRRRFPWLMCLPVLLASCEERTGIAVYETSPPAPYVWPEKEAFTDTAEGLAWEVPAGWVATEDVADALLADYRLPGADEALPGRLTVSMIAGDGGGLNANVDRWINQVLVAQPQDLSGLVRVPPGLRHRFGPLWRVEIDGQYAGPIVPSSMRVAMLTILDRDGRPFVTWFFKMTGDRATVDAAWDDVVRMVYSLRPEGDPVPDMDPPRDPETDPATDPHEGVEGAPALRDPADGEASP